MRAYGRFNPAILAAPVLGLFLLLPGLVQADPKNETVVVVATRLAMVAEVAPVTLTVTKEYKNGADEVRTVDPRDVPPGRDLVSWVNYVSEEMEAAGFTRRPARAPDGHQIWEFVRPAKVIARFSSNITIAGDATVTQDINVALALTKPTWASVRDQTHMWFDPSLTNQQQGRIASDYKRWVSGVIDHFIAQNGQHPVVLDEGKKERLRQPRRDTVSQSRAAPIEGGSDGTLTVRVTSRIVNRRLGVN